MNEYREKLLAEKQELEHRIHALAEPENFGDDVDGLDSKTDESEEFAANLGMQTSFEARLERIEKALRKIEHGEYGICESCGKPIEKEVLDIDPESELCRTCKQAGKE
jgi:RNA polymerase-binding transcription factor DksA